MSVATPVVAIEIYDAGVRIGDGENTFIDCKSCALIESNNILVGEQAEQQTHLRPREISTNFWGQLSEDSTTKHVVSNANIALQHLSYACNEANYTNQAVILITPITLDKQDLGLLLGICKKLSINVVGMVCNAALCMRQPADNCKAVYIDLLQQKLAITELIQNATSISLKQPSRIIGYGLQSFIGNCARSIADKFVSETRFDPLHSAIDEQLFFDMLPLWLSLLEENSSIECKLNTAEKHFSIDIDRQYIQQCNQNLFDEMAAHLNVLFHDHGSIAIFCSPACRQAFGLLEYLTNLPGCAIVPLQQDDIIKHALNCRNEIISDGQVHFINALPWLLNAAPVDLNFNSGRLSNIANKPTHLLADGYAYSLKNNIYLSEDHGNAPIILRDKNANTLCKITAENMNIIVDGLAEGTVSINRNSIDTTCFANIGDVLTINNSQAKYVFIKVVSNET